MYHSIIFVTLPYNPLFLLQIKDLFKSLNSFQRSSTNCSMLFHAKQNRFIYRLYINKAFQSKIGHFEKYGRVKGSSTESFVMVRCYNADLF